MTATNHALVGAAIAIIVKNPVMAIPAAFFSHFLVDLIPHYNPAGITRNSFTNIADNWAKKMAGRTFKVIVITDMVLATLSCISVPLLAPSSVAPWTVFFSMIAAASPDFLGGFEYAVNRLTGKKFKNKKFTELHVRIQWLEKPWGIYVELLSFLALVWLIYNLIQ